MPAIDPKNFIVTDDTRERKFDDELLTSLRSRLRDYLARIGVELTKRGHRYYATCPMHDDRKPSFAVFGERHESGGCFPCGWQGDVLEFAQWTGRANSFPAAVHHVADVLGVSVADGNTSPPRTATRPAAPKVRTERMPEIPHLTAEQRARIHMARLRFSDALHAEEPIIERIAASLGFDWETLRVGAWGSCGLGIDAPPHRQPWLCYAFPHGLKYRNPDPEAAPRFQWIAGKPTGQWRIDWAHRPGVKTIYLTEGESDALALIAAGLEADQTAAVVASPGTSFPREWATMFKGKRVICCFDNDPPGRTATATVAEILKGHADEILTWKGTSRHE